MDDLGESLKGRLHPMSRQVFGSTERCQHRTERAFQFLVLGRVLRTNCQCGRIARIRLGRLDASRLEDAVLRLGCQRLFVWLLLVGFLG